jgi:hypothetical protein
MTNLFIAYDLMTPGKDYTAVHAAIKSLGIWKQLQFSLFYVHTNLTHEQAAAIVWRAIDSNDRLSVINAFGVTIADASQAEINAINQVWNAPAKAA